ncbi:hypothetical protein D9757_004943 [Collybiopsis confluens]|uniref:DUF6533 domain-containing protein n=1 Tax=Collybiopsis confluens TaxID=2823264 RepID=A0A8H5MCP8_9AGAR|nr:hypothetical protein D9757_004943 [Collybiopsis confluens]
MVYPPLQVGPRHFLSYSVNFLRCRNMSTAGEFLVLIVHPQDIIRERFFAHRMRYARAALLLYDVMINLDREIELVWSECNSFQWSNLIYFANRYPILPYMLWTASYTPKISQVSCARQVSMTPLFDQLLSLHCDALFQLFWFLSVITTRIAVLVTWIQRVYAVSDHGFLSALLLSALALGAIATDAFLGAKSTCANNVMNSRNLKLYVVSVGSNRFIISPLHHFPFRTETAQQASVIVAEPVDDRSVLFLAFLTTKIIQMVKESGGFRKLSHRNILEYVLSSGILYLGAVTLPQLMSITVYFGHYVRDLKLSKLLKAEY